MEEITLESHLMMRKMIGTGEWIDTISKKNWKKKKLSNGKSPRKPWETLWRMTMTAKKKASVKKASVKKATVKKATVKKAVKKAVKKKPSKVIAKEKVVKKIDPEVKESKASEGLVVKTIDIKPDNNVKGPAGIKSAKGEATVVVAKEDSGEKSKGKNVVFMGGKAVLVDDNDDSFLS